jgi:hypothetical protein
MSNFNQGVPGVATLINSSATILSGNAASANALTVRQFGGGNVFSVSNASGSTAFFVGANGNVGVGTASPATVLSVQGGAASGRTDLGGDTIEIGAGRTADGQTFIDMHTAEATYPDYSLRIVRFGGANASTQLLQRGTGEISYVTVDAADHAWYTSNAEKMRLTAAGRVGIGAASPPAKLWVSGVTGTSGSFGVFQSDVSVNIGFVTVSNNGIIQVYAGGSSSAVGTTPYSLEIQTAGGALGLGSASSAVTVNSLAGVGNRAVYSTAGGTLTNSSSDQRLKTNVNAITYGLSTVSNLRPISYNWSNTESLGSQLEIGFIAQEVQTLVPEVVGQNTNGMLSLDYQKLVPVLTKAIQELSAENTALKTQMAAMDARLVALEGTVGSLIPAPPS